MIKLNRLGIIFLACTLTAGCSTFEVRDTYKLVGIGKDMLKIEREDIALRIFINPQTRFYSIGLLGIPVIPTHIELASPEGIQVAVNLIMHTARDFSFAAEPCLIADGRNMLCPYEIEISAVALFQDDGSMHEDQRKRWHHIADFYDIEKHAMYLTPTSSRIRIDRQQIYQYYGYTGIPEFDYLQVNLTYKYRCRQTCPDTITLNTDNIAMLENLTIPDRNLVFEKNRVNDYDFSRPVQ